MSPRSRHHLPPMPPGQRDSNLVAQKPFAVIVLVATLSMAALVIGLLSMTARTPGEDTAASDVVLDSGIDSAVSDDHAYPPTVMQFGRLVAIADTSVSIKCDDGAVLAFTITPDTILVPAYGMDSRPVGEQYVRNQPVVVIGHVINGVATATAVVDPGPERRQRSSLPLILA